MARAIWNGEIVAESDDTIVVEGNHYFPRESIKPEFFKDSSDHTVCHWKGTASYFDVEVAGETASAAAWYYPDPSHRAGQIKDYVAFWRGVRVQGDSSSR